MQARGLVEPIGGMVLGAADKHVNPRPRDVRALRCTHPPGALARALAREVRVDERLLRLAARLQVGVGDSDTTAADRARRFGPA